MPDDAEDDGRSFADLVSEPEDVKDLREHIKSLAKDARDRGEEATVDDYLAQSRKNDAAYIAPADLKKAEWIARIYDQESRPETHPRNFHYRILGKGYERPNGKPYTASNSSWTELKEAFKWARIIGLVDSSRIQDAANLDPTAFDDVDTPIPKHRVADTAETVENVAVDDGFRHATIPREIELAECLFEDVDEFIETAAKMIADQTFERLYFDAAAEQRYYIEIWAEKSGVIPEELATEYGATIRESGKGEFSLSMCEAAVDIAEARNQDLAICIVSDSDPKGVDMSIGCSRKSEVIGALNDVGVEVVQAAVTKEQVEEFGIPGDPAKVPDGLDNDVDATACAARADLIQRVFSRLDREHRVICEILFEHGELKARDFHDRLENQLGESMSNKKRNRLLNKIRGGSGYDLVVRTGDGPSTAYRLTDRARELFEAGELP